TIYDQEKYRRPCMPDHHEDDGRVRRPCPSACEYPPPDHRGEAEDKAPTVAGSNGPPAPSGARPLLNHARRAGSCYSAAQEPSRALFSCSATQLELPEQVSWPACPTLCGFGDESKLRDIWPSSPACPA